MRDDGGDEDVKHVFAAPAEGLGGGPWSEVEFAASRRIAFEEAFNSAVDLIEENSLGTGPAAPDTAEERCDEEESEAEAGDAEEQHPDVLKREREAEEVEAARGDIEEDGRMCPDSYPRQREVDGDEEPARSCACSRKT